MRRIDSGLFGPDEFRNGHFVAETRLLERRRSEGPDADAKRRVRFSRDHRDGRHRAEPDRPDRRVERHLVGVAERLELILEPGDVADRLQVGDSVFWTLFAILLVLLAVIPEIADFFGHIFGILSTVNLVYLVIITILIYRVFSLTLRISEMDGKLKELARKIALEEADKRNSERH